jgi:Protein of unknown function (DUF3108)
MAIRQTASLVLLTLLAPAARAHDALPFAAGEEVGFRITWAHLLAGRATMKVQQGTSDGTPVVRFVAEARSQGFFAWLLRYEVSDRTVATWEPSSGCSLAIEKNLHEGRAVRDQSVTFDRAQGLALVKDERMAEHRFPVGTCVLDVLSALFVARIKGVPERGDLALPVFDNGKHYELAVRVLGRETLDLPPPLGHRPLREERAAPALAHRRRPTPARPHAVEGPGGLGHRRPRDLSAGVRPPMSAPLPPAPEEVGG